MDFYMAFGVAGRKIHAGKPTVSGFRPVHVHRTELGETDAK
jgi:hypothetical protein